MIFGIIKATTRPIMNESIVGLRSEVENIIIIIKWDVVPVLAISQFQLPLAMPLLLRLLSSGMSKKTLSLVN